MEVSVSTTMHLGFSNHHVSLLDLGLAASLGYGAASEIIRRTGGNSTESSSSLMMTEANIKRLVSKLSQMRGAALKLGQFMSIQGMLTVSD